MGSRARCRWGDIIRTLAWGVGRTEDPLPDGTLQGHWQGRQPRSSPGPAPEVLPTRAGGLAGSGPQESKEEATVCVIASLRDHNLVFLEYPVGCSVSPAPPRGRHHAGEHSGRAGGQAGGPAALGTNWPLRLGVCLSVQSCQEPPPRVRLGREIAGQDVKHAHR